MRRLNVGLSWLANRGAVESSGDEDSARRITAGSIVTAEVTLKRMGLEEMRLTPLTEEAERNALDFIQRVGHCVWLSGV